MHSLNKGQSILEYLLLACIIFIATVVGGPSLIRAVQSYFKMTDESVQDSASEEIRQAPAIAPPVTSCSCTSWTTGECAVGSCSPIQRYSYRTCNPMHCDAEEQCTPDASCCTLVTPVGCGTKFEPANTTYELPTTNTIATKACNDNRSPLDSHFTAGYRGTCPTTGTDTDCSVGERLYSIQCASAADPTKAATFYGCKFDSETEMNCLPTCSGTVYAASTPCDAAQNADNSILAERINLIPEVLYRQITSPLTTPANPTNSGDTLVPGHDPSLPNHNPYRILLKDAMTTNVLQFNSYQNHFVYLDQTQCAPGRSCQQVCPTGSMPIFEGYLGLHENETCAKCIHIGATITSTSTMPTNAWPLTFQTPRSLLIGSHIFRWLAWWKENKDKTWTLESTATTTIDIPDIGAIDTITLSAVEVDDYSYVQINGNVAFKSDCYGVNGVFNFACQDTSSINWYPPGPPPPNSAARPNLPTDIKSYFHTGSNTVITKAAVYGNGQMSAQIDFTGLICYN